jgi:hypothetical protein
MGLPNEPLRTVPLSTGEVRWVLEMLASNAQGEHPLDTNEIQALRKLVEAYKLRRKRRIALARARAPKRTTVEDLRKV